MAIRLWLHDEGFQQSLPSGLVVVGFQEAVVEGQEKGSWKERVLLFTFCLHPKEVLGEIVFAVESVHSGEVIDLLEWFHFGEKLACDGII